MIGLFIYLIISYPRSLSIHTAPSLLPVLALIFLFSFFPSLLLSPLLLRAVSGSISELCSHLSRRRGRKATSFIDAACFSVSHSLRPLFIYLLSSVLNIFALIFFHLKLSQPSCASCFWANPVGGLHRYSCSMESLPDLDLMADCIKMKNGLRSHSLPLPRLLDTRILAMLDVLLEIHVNTHKSFFMEYFTWNTVTRAQGKNAIIFHITCVIHYCYEL